MLQSRSWYAEFAGRSRRPVHPSSAFAQRSLNDLLLLRRKLPQRFKSTARHSDRRLSREPTFINCELLRFAYDDRSLDHILQFTNITRPRVRLKQIEALLAQGLKALSCLPCETINEVLNQQGNVFLSFTQRRHFNWKNVESVKQVAPERPRGDGSLQVAVRGGNYPNISPDGSSGADTLKLVFLQNTQKSDLGLGRKLSDLVEEDRASFGQLKAAYTPLSCPCKRALLMAE